MSTCFVHRNIDKWMHQNGAEVIDMFEGTLHDNYLLACRRGYAVAFVKPVSEWASVHAVMFRPYSDDDCTELFSMFYERKDEREREWREWCEWNNAREGSAA